MSVDNPNPTTAEELPEDVGALHDVVEDLLSEVAQLRAEKEALHQEVRELREEVDDQESVEFRGDTKDIDQLFIGGVPIGITLEKNRSGRKKLNRAVFGDPENPGMSENDIQERVDEHGSLYETLGTVEAGSGPGEAQNRESMLPLHRMMVDMRTGADSSLSMAQKRAAALYERFVKKAEGEANQNVTPDGQKLSMNTEQAVEILEDEVLLESVKPKSYSKTAGRVMRDVQRFTIVEQEEHEDCTDVDKCSDHGLINFRSGKPHTLTVPKKKMKASVLNTSPSDKDVRTADDGETRPNSPEDDSADDEMERLEKATKVEGDD